jgi:hypothetical protein
MAPGPNATAPNPRPDRSEWIAALILIGGFFLFNLATSNLYPAVWCDEALYSEPAINFVRFGTYTTVGYEFQPPNTFPIVNCPLYGLTLIPWLALTGSGLLAVRSYNYALMALGAFLCWNVTWRFGLVRSRFPRLLLLVLLHLGYGMSFSYRCCRPDMLGMVCLLLLLLSFRITRPPWRRFCLLGLSAFAVWIGLQVALYACFGCVIGWAAFRWVRFKDIILLGAGMAVGAALLVCFMSAQGVLPYFLPPILGVVKGDFYAPPSQSAHDFAVLSFFKRLPGLYLEDFSALFLTPLLLVLVTVARKRLSPLLRDLAVYCSLLFFGVPMLFETVGHYAFYYSYLRFVPAAIAILAAYSELTARSKPGIDRWWRPAFAAALIGTLLAGLPLRLALAFTCSRLSSHAEIQRVLNSRISPHDVVLSEYLSFFEAKKAAHVVYNFYASSVLCPCGIPGFDLSPQQKQAVSVLVIRPQQKDQICGFFGGDWKAVTEPFGDLQDFSRIARLPLIGSRFAHYALQPQTERYQVQIFRRTPNSTPIPLPSNSR